jgi:hypothetical protein
MQPPHPSAGQQSQSPQLPQLEQQSPQSGHLGRSSARHEAQKLAQLQLRVAGFLTQLSTAMSAASPPRMKPSMLRMYRNFHPPEVAEETEPPLTPPPPAPLLLLRSIAGTPTSL